MRKEVVSATELKKNTAEILNLVHFHKKPTVVERYGRAIVEIIPLLPEKKTTKSKIPRLLDNYFGSLPNFPPVKSTRKFRKREISL